MNELSIIDPAETHSMLVSWDLGRRCNYDCTYCPSHRHDNHSPHASLEELKKTANFVFEYLSLILPYKKKSSARVSFTGGEPTLNPHFMEFSQWLINTHKEQYSDQYKFGLSITSNGATSRVICDHLVENYRFSTISYHCEGHPRLKAKVLENIAYLKERGFPFKVNVMFHAREDYFQECLEVCKKLHGLGVNFSPRMLGEHDDNNRYHHKYTGAQKRWMKEFWNNKENPTFRLSEEKSPQDNPRDKDQHTARSIGRPCCGNRDMHVCSSDKQSWKTTQFLNFAKFKNWYCTVNWFFLHIEQQTGEIFHHQTCQANFGGKREPIAKTNNTQPLLDRLRAALEEQRMPVIVCPNQLCGCGLCTPKARDAEDLQLRLEKHIDPAIFKNSPEFNNKTNKAEGHAETYP
jgi:MoaA/NifB/PqqE/SkfB family radical SAM enzyme